MKVVITGYNTCCLNHSGGVKNRVKEIYEHLSKCNELQVEYFRPMETEFENVDILHLFKLEPEYFNLVRKAKKSGIKIVLSSIVPLYDGWKIDIYRRFINRLPILTVYKMSFSILSLIDKLIVETQTEADFILKHYRVDKNKIEVIPNGIDIYTYDGMDIFERIGNVSDYVLHVGLFHENKNQLRLIKALKGTGIDVVFIGGEENGDSTYFDKCKSLAANDKHFHFLGWSDRGSNLLKSAYKHARVFAFPSFQETFGMALIEGAAAGSNIVVSKTLPIHDFHVFDDALFVDPNDENSIRQGVLEAFNTPLNTNLQKRVINFFSWESVIDKHIKLYSSLYGNK